jgi:hypothetical protein
MDYHMGDITVYTVWRALEEAAAMEMIELGTPVVCRPQETAPAAASGAAAALLLAYLDGESYYWELAASQDAYGFTEYSKVVPTMFDSTAASSLYHYFQVVAHTADPMVFYASEPDSGYSVDNLAPCPPLSLAGEQSYNPEGLLLTWDGNSEPDLGWYHVYRGTDGSFEPGPGNLLCAPADTTILDGTWDWQEGYWYKVAAVDIHGNESGYAVLGPDMITGDEPVGVPDATFLEQNWPNPFNPLTTIEFGLEKGEHVSLRVYDVAGRLVSTLVEGDLPAGRYEERWDGTGRDGGAVASGIYFYRLVTGDFVRTRKMVLLR